MLSSYCLESQIYDLFLFYMSLWAYNINILSVRIVRRLLCILLFLLRYTKPDGVEKGKSCCRFSLARWIPNLWMFETLPDGKLSKFSGFSKETLFIEYEYGLKTFYVHVDFEGWKELINGFWGEERFDVNILSQWKMCELRQSIG